MVAEGPAIRLRPLNLQGTCVPLLRDRNVVYGPLGQVLPFGVTRDRSKAQLLERIEQCFPTDITANPLGPRERLVEIASPHHWQATTGY